VARVSGRRGSKVALEGLYETLGHALAFHTFDRREVRDHVSTAAVSMVLRAAKIEPFSESHCTRYGARKSCRSAVGRSAP
jgi:hypothetical protein